MHKFHHLLGCHAIGINSLTLFLTDLRFSNLICQAKSLTKKLSWLDWKLKQYAWQKSFLKIVIKVTVFLISSGNQELIHHTHCFGYIFCHQNKTRKFWYGFIFSCPMIFTLNYIHWMSQTLNNTSLYSSWLIVATTFLWIPVAFLCSLLLSIKN